MNAKMKREFEDANREHNVITSMTELLGWEIILIERWKPGVVRFYARRPGSGGMEFQTGFADDEVFAAYQLPK